MDAVYEVHGLTKRYGRSAALNGVDLPLCPAGWLVCWGQTAAARPPF